MSRHRLIPFIHRVKDAFRRTGLAGARARRDTACMEATMDRTHIALTRSEAFAEDLIEAAAPTTDRAWAWLLALAPVSVALLAVGIALLPPLA
jgi:hypothetical protein